MNKKFLTALLALCALMTAFIATGAVFAADVESNVEVITKVNPQENPDPSILFGFEMGFIGAGEDKPQIPQEAFNVAPNSSKKLFIEPNVPFLNYIKWTGVPAGWELDMDMAPVCTITEVNPTAAGENTIHINPLEETFLIERNSMITCEFVFKRTPPVDDDCLFGFCFPIRMPDSGFKTGK